MSADPPEDDAWVLMDIRDALVRIADAHDTIIGYWERAQVRDDLRMAQLSRLESEDAATAANTQLADLIAAAIKRAYEVPA